MEAEEIRVSVTLENSNDRSLAEQGYSLEAEVRRRTIEGIVDSGAMVSLVIPEEVVTQSGTAACTNENRRPRGRTAGGAPGRRAREDRGPIAHRLPGVRAGSLTVL